MHARTLKRLRKRLGWTQARLAAEMGVHRMTIQKWESGQRTMSKSHEILFKVLVDRYTLKEIP